MVRNAPPSPSTTTSSREERRDVDLTEQLVQPGARHGHGRVEGGSGFTDDLAVVEDAVGQLEEVALVRRVSFVLLTRSG
jgi:hypothetical protein